MDMWWLLGGLVTAVAILYRKWPVTRPSPLAGRYIMTKTADGEHPSISGASDPQNTGKALTVAQDSPVRTASIVTWNLCLFAMVALCLAMLLCAEGLPLVSHKGLMTPCAGPYPALTLHQQVHH